MMVRALASPMVKVKSLGAQPPKGSGAIGSASVSKTDGWGFESLLPCVCGHVP